MALRTTDTVSRTTVTVLRTTDTALDARVIDDGRIVSVRNASYTENTTNIADVRNVNYRGM